MPPARILLALLLLAAPPWAPPAWADVDGSHPLTNQPFPLRAELGVRTPAAFLVWQAEDGATKRKFGEAKLVELVASQPALSARSLQVRNQGAEAVTPFGNGIVTPGWIAPAQVDRLKATETPFIVTVDLQGRIHRFSYLDHWPMLSVADPRFGTPPAPKREGLWRRIRRSLGLN